MNRRITFQNNLVLYFFLMRLVSVFSLYVCDFASKYLFSLLGFLFDFVL